ncbi:hypothetical protein WICPIJ_002102 [Wickerhamomyces pijperi]|uniref:Complex 1 LYR protein domain-containing protein n=1 Tax=Wickerhamomyces pijperi TaxID=599730 RepID=A0A9P8TPZ9_WICPI|nr:hypothetical protein WICPIJ_002102 [Wickerhamomyces pijperi]
MKPVVFSKLPQHQTAVLSLYRELLRHLTHLPTINSDFAATGKLDAKELKNQLKGLFHIHKGLRSPHQTRNKLTQGYELDTLLRQWFNFPVTRPVVSYQIQTLLTSTEPKDPKKKSPQLKNKYGERIKRDLNNQQDLVTQQRQNYLTRHVKTLNRQNRLPKLQNIDPEVLKSLLVPEALYQRAKLDIVRSKRLLQKGPYQPRIVKTSSGLQFVRTPFVQAPVIGRLIGLRVRNEQNLINLQNEFLLEKHLYEWEDLYETEVKEEFGDGDVLLKRGYLKDGETLCDWKESIEHLIDQKQDEVHRVRTWMKLHTKKKSALILKHFETQCEKWYQKKRKRWHGLEDELKKFQVDSPFEKQLLDLTNEGDADDLWKVIDKYHFSSAKKPHSASHGAKNT